MGHRSMKAIIPLPAALPQHEPQLYAALRQAGVPEAEAIAAALATRPAPAPDAREVQRQRWREHGRLPAVRAYTGS